MNRIKSNLNAVALILPGETNPNVQKVSAFLNRMQEAIMRETEDGL